LRGIEQIQGRRTVLWRAAAGRPRASRSAPAAGPAARPNPLAGLAAAERERVSSLVKNIAANIRVLIVEHDIDPAVLGFSPRTSP